MYIKIRLLKDNKNIARYQHTYTLSQWSTLCKIEYTDVILRLKTNLWAAGRWLSPVQTKIK